MNNDPRNTTDDREDSGMIEFTQSESRSEWEANRELAATAKVESEEIQTYEEFTKSESVVAITDWALASADRLKATEPHAFAVGYLASALAYQQRDLNRLK